MNTRAKLHKAVFNSPPEYLPSGQPYDTNNGRWRIWEHAGTKVDAALLGNGDMLAALAGPPQWPQFWISTNDFWQMESALWEYFQDNSTAKYGPPMALGSPRPIGRIVFDIPAMEGAGYHVEQDFYKAVTTAVFTAADGAVLTMESFVAAQENLLVTAFTATKSMEVDVSFLFPNWGKDAILALILLAAKRRKNPCKGLLPVPSGESPCR